MSKECSALIDGLLQLALHVAQVPGNVAQIAAQSQIQASTFSDPSPARASELVPALGESIA